MHIDQNRINQPLNEQEKQHLLACQQCRDEQQMLTQLRQDSVELPLMTPPEHNWQMLKLDMNKKRTQQIQSPVEQTVVQLTRHKRNPWQNITAIAATVMLSAFGWLMWNNHQLQGQLEQVLQVNQNLELQLNQENMPGFRQARLLMEIRSLEHALDQAQSKTMKINLLKQRQQLIADMIETQKGEADDFSI